MKPLDDSAQQRDTAGFALAGVLIILTVLFAVAVPTLLTVQQEWKISEAVVEAAEAEEAADALTVDLLAAWDSSFYALGVWQDTTFQEVSDAATVTFTVTRTSDQLFLIEAQAATSGGDFSHGSALTVRAAGLELTPHAALTVGDSATIANGATLSGSDAVNPPDWPSSVCVGSTVRNMPGVLGPMVTLSGGGVSITGFPSIQQDSSVTLATIAEPGGIPFKTLASQADHTLGTLGGTPTGGCSSGPLDWGSPSDPTGPCGDHFPIIHLQAGASLPPGTRGQGILLVEGDLTLSGDVAYYGMIVVLGRLQITGLANRIRGAVYAQDASLDAGGASTNPMIYNTSCVMDRVRAAHPELGSGVHPVSSRSWLDLSGMD